MTANQEIEVKLELDGDEGASRRLQEALEARFGPGRAMELISTYFDTADLALREAALSLRIRKVGGRRLQTIKTRSTRKGGMFARSEWEREIEGDEPDLRAADDTPLGPLLRHDGVKAGLAPAFESVIERTVWDVKQDQDEIEVALDRGIVRADGRSALVCEMELELKSGDPERLLSLARSLDDIAPFRLGARSKADRGYQLLAKTDRSAVQAEAPALSLDMTVGEAFQEIARSCVRHFMLNEPLVIGNRSEEALHQARVALRRLRSAFSVFRTVVEDEEAVALKSRLKTLSQSLGAARNLDIFLKSLLDSRVQDAAADALASQVRERRREAYEAAVKAMSAPEARRLMLDLSVWIEAGPWTTADTSGDRDRPALMFAAEVLERRTAQVVRSGRHLERLTPEERHEVRIRTKKLRYAAEFFAGLYSDRKDQRRQRAFVEAVKGLQTELGELNDIVQAEALAEELAHAFGEQKGSPGGRRRLIYAAGREAGRRAAAKEQTVGAAVTAYERFRNVKSFW